MKLLEDLTGLDDGALHGALKHTAGRANTLTAQLLAQLAELEARGLYRERACASLYTYCVYELRMSEDEAQRRCRAARLARQFPVLLQMLAESSIHLTGILLLGPHLTVENHRDLLERARHRTKRELERLVALIAPRADVPTLIVPLRRAGAEDNIAPQDAGGASPRPRNTWAAFVQALAGPVRRLQSGTGAGQAPPPAPDAVAGLAPAEAAPNESPSAASDPQRPAPAGMRYQVQFSADQAYIDLLEEVRDLLQHEVPDRNLVEAQRRALQLLVEQLRRRKHAASERAREAAAPATPAAPAAQATPAAPAAQAAPGTRATPAAPAPATRAAPGVQATAAAHGRHLPATLRRAVWRRDDGRCAYADERGVRCRETAGLEYHHLQPYARGGPSTEENVALRCRAHNALAAENDFGADHMRQCRSRDDQERRAGAAGAGSRDNEERGAGAVGAVKSVAAARGRRGEERCGGARSGAVKSAAPARSAR